MSSERARLEEAIQQLLVQLDELREAIRVVQARTLAISSEIQEIRMAFETLSSVQKLTQREVLASLDRNGYVFAKALLLATDEALVRIGKEYYAVLPIDKVKSILTEYEKDLTEELRETEAELRRLTELYNQIQRRVQEYAASLQRLRSSEKQ
ncbi:MAG: prefoldin subunit alpha [Ignisphaera sp.]|jgi:prefoldin alpha subunit|nr:prefoldin subunit alpha [Ignisphaera sp.]MCC6056150.1 prefoldin subunit alpha [Desulfurococcaceae archaeon]